MDQCGIAVLCACMMYDCITDWQLLLSSILKYTRFQKLHLPPELSETASRAQEDSTTQKTQTPLATNPYQSRSASGSRTTTVVKKDLISKHNIDF